MNGRVVVGAIVVGAVVVSGMVGEARMGTAGTLDDEVVDGTLVDVVLVDLVDGVVFVGGTDVEVSVSGMSGLRASCARLSGAHEETTTIAIAIAMSRPPHTFGTASHRTGGIRVR